MASAHSLQLNGVSGDIKVAGRIGWIETIRWDLKYSGGTK